MATLNQLRLILHQIKRTNLSAEGWCYIAGPMRGIPYFNYPAFEDAAQRLRNAGWLVQSPRENDKESGHAESRTGAAEDAKPLKYYMATDLSQVCKSDAVFLLEGWEHSQGALLEFNVAQYLGIPVFRYEDGGSVTVLGSDESGQMLGIDHQHLEDPELTHPFDGLLGEGRYQAPDEQLREEYERARNEGIIAARMHEAVLDARNAYQDSADPDPGDVSDSEKTKEGYRLLAEAVAAASPSKPLNLDPLLDLFEEPTAETLGNKKYPVEAGVRHPNSARFHALLREMGELHDRKQADYGRGDDPFANVRSSDEWGMPAWVGGMVRLNDKVRRLQTMAKTGRLLNESAVDSFMDIAVYAIICRVLFEEEQNGTG